MTNNTPDYNDNLYFKENKMDCKNCPYTDEYCASGDCERDNDLTEKWKKGELPCGWYYVEGNRAEGIYAYTAEYLNNMYRPRNGERIIEQVPSYEEWKEYQELDEDYKRNVQLAIRFSLEADILKALLKECRRYLIMAEEDCGWDRSELIQQIDEALQ